MKRFVAVLFLVGCLGGATEAYGAEVPPPTISVEGVSNVAISQTANQAEANTAYRRGLTAAISDGHEKAEFLAAGTGATVGAIQQVIERGGYIECAQPAEEGPLTEYQQYKGAEPDFGSVESSGSRFAVAPESAAGTRSTKTTKPKTKKKKHKAKAKKAAVAVSCTVSTQLVLSYLLM